MLAACSIGSTSFLQSYGEHVNFFISTGLDIPAIFYVGNHQN